MKELKFEELSTKQKLGMVSCGYFLPDDSEEVFKENLEYTLNLIRNHSLGSVWVAPSLPNIDYIIGKIKETADYPVLILADAESGIGDYIIGNHNALGTADNEEYAYAFGKVVGATARKIGCNIICNPILDAFAGIRTLGTDKHRVTALSSAISQGMHDAGVLTVAKHYPSAKAATSVDSHMAQPISYLTKEKLLEDCLYPYIELNKKGLIDGIMTGHTKLVNIDPDYPTSLSRKVIDVFKEQGFEGFAITDCLEMMGVVATFGPADPKGLCIEAGNHIALGWYSAKKAYEDICDCYERGIISDKCLDEATKKILELQYKVSHQPEPVEITEKDIENFNNINRDTIVAKVDEGVLPSISRDGKHYFVLMVQNGSAVADDGKVSLDTFTTKWYNPNKIMERLMELFPNSACDVIDQFPSPAANQKILNTAENYDDTVFFTFTEEEAYIGLDRFTSRILALLNSLMVNKRISTLVHFGLATVLEDLTDHFPRVIIGGKSPVCADYTLDVLAGIHQPKGNLTYNVNLK